MSSSPDHSPLRPLVAIVGPTASGKSALGVRLAEKFNGEVVCCDSTQVYRGFDIGTAKPTAQERRGVAHHLLDILEPHELFTAGAYRKRVIPVLGELCGRGRLPVFTVGTGLYLRALLEGLADAPTRSEELRTRLAARAKRGGPGYLHRILKRLDPAAAVRIAPRDEAKLVRAIEVCVLARRPVTEIYRAGRPRLEGYHAIKVGLNPPRTELYERIEHRVHAMLERGWLAEFDALRARGIAADAKPFGFIGYRELASLRAGRLSAEKLPGAIAQATRRYAKRQLTWFRKEAGVRWFAGFGDDPAIASAIGSYIAEQLQPFLPAEKT